MSPLGFGIIFVFCLLLVAEISAWQDDRIVGGRPAVKGEFPFQVSLRRSYNDNHFCGGSVIGPRQVLTAAHCMYYMWGGVLPAMTVSTVAGQIHLQITDKSVVRNATFLHIYDGYDSQSKSNDIAIVEVDEPFPLTNEEIAIVALRTKPVRPKTNCTVSGWGYTNFSSDVVSEDLLAADVQIIDFKQCQVMYCKLNISLASSMLCAGVPEGNKDACQGDSGGPLFCDGYLTGIVSTGIGCGDKDFPGLYTDVSQFIPWINSILYPGRRSKKY